MPNGHSQRRALNVSFCLIEHTIGLIHKVAHKRRSGIALIPVSHHFVALALQVVNVGQDKGLLASSGLNELPRDGDLELFDVLRFNFDLHDRVMDGFGKPLRW